MRWGKNHIREQKAFGLREAGLTYAAIGRELGVHTERARQLAGNGRRRPIEPDEVVFLPALEADTPTKLLPLRPVARQALVDVGIEKLGDLASADFHRVNLRLKRYPGVGLRTAAEIWQLLYDWLTLQREVRLKGKVRLEG